MLWPVGERRHPYDGTVRRPQRRRRGHRLSGPDVLHLLFGGLGGQRRLVLDLVAGFSAVGLRSDVVVLGHPDEVLTEPDDWPGVARVHVIPRRTRLDRTSAAMRTVLADARNRSLLWHSGYAARAVRAARRRGGLAAAVFVEHQSTGLRRLPEDLRSLAGILTADRTVVLSESYLATHHLRRLRLRGLRRAVIIPNGVDLTAFRPADVVRPPGPTRLVLVGRLIPSREAVVAVRAVERLRERGVDVHLEVIGDGAERDRISAEVQRSGLADRVVLRGAVSEDTVPARLRAADIYLHPSQGEARSTALLQAWATGLPVVAARVTGIADLVREGEDGLLVPPSDPHAMADAVQRLIAHRDLADGLGRAGRRRAELEFSVDVTVRGYLDVLADVDPEGPWRDALARSQL